MKSSVQDASQTVTMKYSKNMNPHFCQRGYIFTGVSGCLGFFSIEKATKKTLRQQTCSILEWIRENKLLFFSTLVFRHHE